MPLDTRPWWEQTAAHLSLCALVSRRMSLGRGVPKALQLAVILAISSAISAPANASSALLRSGGPTPPELAPIKMYDGAVQGTITPVRPSGSLTVVLLSDGMDPAILEGLKADLAALFDGLHGRSFRLAVVHDGTMDVSPAIQSRLRLQSLLKAIAPPAGTGAPGASVLDTIVASTQQMGSRWSQALLVGDFPSLDAAAKDYSSAVLLRAFTAQQVRVSWFPLSAADDAWLPLFQATAGTIVKGSLSEYLPTLDDAGQPFARIDWTPASPASGFVVFQALISDLQEKPVLQAPDIATSAVTLPTIQAYTAMEKQLIDAETLVANAELSEAQKEQARSALSSAFTLNPLEPAALTIAIALDEKVNDFASAITHATSLVEVHPQDGNAYAALGHALLLASESERADTALQRALSLNAHTVQVNEDLARIRLGRYDDKGSLPYLDEALHLDPKRQDLWFLQAKTGERLRDSGLAIHAYEEGLALGGDRVPEVVSLLKLYVSAKDEAKARGLIERTLSTLPPDVHLRSEFAVGLDELKQSGDALLAWRRVLEVQPDSEPAHYRISRLLLDSGDAATAEKEAAVGLESNPKSGRLYIARGDALQKLGQRYAARELLLQAVNVAPETEVLARFASMQDTYGSGASEAYAQLVDVLPSTAATRADVLQRGFVVSVRDGDLKRAEYFAKSLKASGHAEFQQLLTTEAAVDSGTVIPGGIEALAFAARAKEGIPRERFFVEYCRALVDQAQNKALNGKNPVIEDVEQHFERINDLEALGRRDGNRVLITLSLANKQERHGTDKALSIIGIKLHSAKGEVEVARGEKKSQTEKQETASALALDEVGIQEALQAGKSYELEIRDEWVPVYPDEKIWRQTFYPKKNQPGTFPLELLHNPKMARLYIGLSSLDRKTISELLSAVPLNTLADKYSELLYLFAPAFALQGSHAVVAGGTQAEPLWAQLVGASPSTPGAFFRNLLERDNGKLLAFFFDTCQLDLPHQMFFTATEPRLSRFYKLLADSQEMQHGPTLERRNSFAEFLRSIPIDEQGHLDFPGSPEVWIVANGTSASDSKTAKLLKKVSKVAAPDVEDEVLLRMAQTRYKDSGIKHSELENFLAVARIDAHRKTPLDEESALLLAQQFGEDSAAYPYFDDLSDLSAADFRQFFAVIDHIKTHSPLEANFQIGEFHALIEWICLFQRRRVISEQDATKLFRYLCERFASAEGEAAYTEASLDTAHSILDRCGRNPKENSADAKLRACLVADVPSTGDQRVKDFQALLEIQKVPALEPLFAFYQAARKLSTDASATDQIGIMEKAAASMPAIDLAKHAKVPGREKDELQAYDPVPLKKELEDLRQKVGKRKPNPKDVGKLSQELLAHLEPQVNAALAGAIYAFFLRPSDLVVSEDPLLLRKHRYFDFVEGNTHHETFVAESAFYKQSEGLGSYFVGGFAQFAIAVGSAARVGWKAANGTDDAVSAEIAAIRSTSWEQLKESDQRLIALRILVAREWVVQSARNPDVLLALREETVGLLSLSRRADLLNSIVANNWTKTWESITLPDLFQLGGKYLQRFRADPWASPVTQELRAVAAENDGSRLNIFGGLPYHAFGCAHPHLLPDAPYEAYELHLFPVDLAERAAEFKLFLAFRADNLGVEPSALAAAAEPLAAKAFRSAHMTDTRDWRSLLSAYASVSTKDLKQALEP